MDRFYNLEKEAVLRHFNVTERGLNQKQVRKTKNTARTFLKKSRGLRRRGFFWSNSRIYW